MHRARLTAGLLKRIEHDDKSYRAMTRIDRQPEAFTEDAYDLVIVGGGVYGATLLYEAARRGLRALLLEKGDFGGGVSANSLRIVHGGLRYLQNMELRRHRESTNERRWHFRQFPDLVAPLKCMMPLYGKGLKRPSTFRVALAMNDIMAFDRNRDVRPDRHLPRGRIASANEVRSAFPLVVEQSLKGAGIWYDGVMLSSERVVIELLRHAAANGGRALNYAEVRSLDVENGRVTGVRAVDTTTEREHTYRAKQVINCAGPWCRQVAETLDRDAPELYRKSLAFNLLFDRPAVSAFAVAVEPPLPDAAAYFIVPWKGKMLAGTRHILFDGDPEAQTPPGAEIDRFIEELNLAMPGLEAQRSEVRRVYAGMLPAMREGEPDMAHEPVLVDHGKRGGPSGLVSVSGVKWTTARDVAERTLKLALPSMLPVRGDAQNPTPFEPQLLVNIQHLSGDADRLGELLHAVYQSESVVHLDDLLLRRMDGLDTDQAVLAGAEAGLELFEMNEREAEFHRLIFALDARQDRGADALRSAGMPGDAPIDRVDNQPNARGMSA